MYVALLVTVCGQISFLRATGFWQVCPVSLLCIRADGCSVCSVLSFTVVLNVGEEMLICM